MRERLLLSRISILLLSSLLFGSSIGDATAALTIKKLEPLAEIGAGYQSLALTSTHFALVGEGIEIRDRSSGVSVVVQESSTSTFFTDVTTSSESFIAVGISESSVITARDLVDGAINPDSVTVKSEDKSQVGPARLL